MNLIKSLGFWGSVLVALSMVSNGSLRADSNASFIELRTFKIDTKEQHQLVADFLADAVVPALKRAKIGPVGVFKEKQPSESLDIMLVIPFDSLEEAGHLGQILSEDYAFGADGRDYLMAPKSSPAFGRQTTAWFKAFDEFPWLKAPVKSKERFFELRVYASHSEIKGMLKVEMFNEGEIEIFNRVGLNGVFYGQAVVGGNLPNLTYMLGFDSEEAHKKAWDGFRKDSQWQQMRTMERYKDTVSKIDKTFLVPLRGSQI